MPDEGAYRTVIISLALLLLPLSPFASSPGIANSDETWAYQPSLIGPPGPPRNLTATPGDALITLAWSPPADDGGSPIANYRIYRGTRSGSLLSLIETGNVLGHRDASLATGVTYYYQVAAVNAVGEGPRSNEASAALVIAWRADWTRLAPSPSSRYSHAMAYDVESDRVILFGGAAGTGVTDETWTYDFNSDAWTEMHPTTSPSWRTQHAMAYDVESDRTILFGGVSSGGLNNETWAYDYNNDTWTKMEQTITPFPWHDVTMAYDTESDRVILFGALGPDGNANETWAFDFNTNHWMRMNPATSPSTGGGHAMAYDADSARVVLFGGYGDGDKTWAYDFNNDSWTEMRPAASPSWRCCHAMAYDADSARVVLFGGWTGSVNGETWSYDFVNNTWIALNPVASPSGRTEHAMAYDGDSDRVVLFGGYGGGSETWAYDLNSNAWARKGPATPSPRCCHAMAYDSESDRIVLFGGADDGFHDDTWVYDFNTDAWTPMNPASGPSARGWHQMAYDSGSDRVILFGGGGSSGLSDETWAYDFNTNTWSRMDPATRPGPRAGHAMAYDVRSDRMILFGGGTGTGLSDETWVYDFDNDTWSMMEPAVAPSARDYLSMAYDTQSDRVILFGGTGTNDTWAYDFDNDSWTNLKPVVAPSVRFAHAMAYDSAADWVIMFGGRVDPEYGGILGDTWGYDINAQKWTKMASRFAPSPRSFIAMAYDSKSGRVILFGGWTGVYDSETWAFRRTPAVPPSAPQSLVATAGVAQIHLAWGPPVDDGGSPVTNYRIYRGTVSESLSFFDEVGNVLTYADMAVTNGVAYHYQVSAVSRVGEGPRSAEASATPRSANAPPVAGFSRSPAFPLEGEPVTFADTSVDPDGSGDILAWLWEFGDGTMSVEQNPVHTFAANATYAVRLTVTDSVGHTDSVVADLVVADKDPAPSFAYVPAAPREGEEVVFADTSESFDGIVRWAWDFGDGFMSAEQNPTHAYEQDGAFLVILRVFEADGDQVGHGETILVRDVEPAAEFSWTPPSPMEGEAVSFADASASYDGIVTWEWDLDGDGLVDATVAAPTLAYRQDGEFQVRLTVTEADGDSGTITKSVTVADADPLAAFAFDPTTPEEGASVSFRDTSRTHDGLAAWAWDFGDGTGGSERNPIHAYVDDGIFVVTLSVREADGDVSTISAPITIQDVDPVADFVFDPAEPRAGEAVSFGDRSISYDGVVAWSWDFGDGTASAMRDPKHAFVTAGTFTVTLTVSEADGDAATASKIVTLLSPPQPPVASFTHTIDGLTVTVDASASTDADGRIVSYDWDWGDGTPRGFGGTGTHAYAADGAYVITLTATDDDGLTDTATRQVIVAAPVDTTDPFIIITSPANGAVLTTRTATVTGTASDDVAVEKVELSTDGVSWVLATGTTTWTSTLTLREGVNTIFARATDSAGNSAATSVIVTVEFPQVGPRFSPTDPLVLGLVTVIIAVIVALLVVRRTRGRRQA